MDENLTTETSFWRRRVGRTFLNEVQNWASRNDVEIRKTRKVETDEKRLICFRHLGTESLLIACGVGNLTRGE
jgi:hypothetical protein